MRLLLFLFLAIGPLDSLRAAITVGAMATPDGPSACGTSTTLTFQETAAKTDGSGPPNGQAAYPQCIGIASATGTLSIGSWSGDTWFTMNARLCTPASQGNPCVTATTAPALLYIYSDGYAGFFHFAGEQITPSIVITDGASATLTVNVTYRLVANPVKVRYTSLATQTGYTQSDSHLWRQGDLDTPPDDYTPSKYGTTPIAVGSTFIDTYFGTVWTAITGVQQSQSLDALVSSYNCVPRCGAGTRLVGTLYFAPPFTTNIDDPQGGGRIYTNVPVSSVGAFHFSSISPNVIHRLTEGGLTYNKVTLITPPSTWTDVAGFTYDATQVALYGAATTLTTGGDDTVSPDDWGCMYATNNSTTKVAYFVNRNTFPFTTYAFNLAPVVPPGWILRTCQTSLGVDRVSGYRYMEISDYNGLGVRLLGLKNGVVTDLGWLPTQTENAVDSGYFNRHCTDAAAAAQRCFSWGHMGFVQHNGIQYIINPVNGRKATWGMIQLFRLNAGDNMIVDEAFGGGGQVIHTTFTQSKNFDLHVAIAQNPSANRAVFLATSEFPGTNACPILGITAGANPTLTFPSGCRTFAVNDPIWISGVGNNGAGCSNINGAYTVTAQTATTIQITFAGCATAWSASCSNADGFSGPASGVILPNANLVNWPHVAEATLYIWDETNNWEVRRVSRLPHVFSNNATCFEGHYYSQPRCGISQNGEEMICAINRNNTDSGQVMAAKTSYKDTPPAWQCCYSY